MKSGSFTLLRYSPVARVATLAGVLVAANANAALSTVSNVTLYPGGATVERQVQVPAGSSRIEVVCLPSSFDPQSLRLLAPPGVQLGDFRIEDVASGDEQSSDRCAPTASDNRVQALQARLAALNARAHALELSAQYLKSVSEQNATTGGRSPVLTVSRGLEQSGFAVYSQRDQVKQQQADTQRRLEALRGDANDHVPTRTLRIALDAVRGGLLTITYDTKRAGWIPAYQATLDSASGEVVLERRALVAQATGEDWRGVKLRLSTGTPARNASSPQPYNWRLNLAEPRPEKYAPAPQPPAPAPMPVMEAQRPDSNTPLFAPTQIEGAYLTMFEIPNKIDVPSDAQKVGFTLARKSMSVKLVDRVIPNQSARAWLIAASSRPDGVWPDGTVQLRRDGAYVGEINWSGALHDNELLLPFGPDEQVITTVADSGNSTGTVKTFGDGASKTLSRRYTVRNLHRTPINVEIVESTPISDSADIKVTSNFTPEPDDAAWQGRQDIVAWKRTLAAGGEASVGAIYTVQYPGKRTIIGLP